MVETPHQTWAKAVAYNIRRIQSSWADDNEVHRRETIRKEIRKALEQIPAPDRAAKIKALREHFPVEQNRPMQIVEVVKEAPPRRYMTEEHLEFLVKAAKDLTETQRQIFGARLKAAGFQVAELLDKPQIDSASRSFSLPEPTAERLGFKTPPKVSLQQVCFLLHELVECMITLERNARRVRSSFAKRSKMGGSLARAEQLDSAAIFARYLLDDDESTIEKVRTAVYEYRCLLTRYTELPKALQHNLVDRLNELFKPEVVEEFCGEGGVMTNKFKLRWDLFCKLWEKHGMSIKSEDSKFWGSEFSDIVSKSIRDEPTGAQR